MTNPLDRLQKSKADYEHQQEVKRIAEEKERDRNAVIAKEAGRKWALEVASYEELLDLCRDQAVPGPMRPARFADVMGPHEAPDFQRGAKEVLRELEPKTQDRPRALKRVRLLP
jgi:hypothetical protein